ncbi:MAG: hypothetical protein AAGC55_11130 [Myxococcota bacterium]
MQLNQFVQRGASVAKTALLAGGVLAMAACGATGDVSTPGGGGDGGDDGDRGTFVSIAAGSFAALPPYADIAGRAQILRAADQTIVELHIEGITPNTEYPVHVHAYPCEVNAAGGHYLKDPTILDVIESNELWPQFTSDELGVGRASISDTHLARPDAQSIVVHDPLMGNAKMACANLILPASGPEETRSGSVASFAAAEEIDQTIVGSAELKVSDLSTTVTLNLSGLDPAAIYRTHVHALPCEVDNGGGHYKIDPAIDLTEELNELWPDFIVEPDGTALVTYENEHLARPDAQSVVIHREIGLEAPKVACANLTRATFVDLQTQVAPTLLQAGIERGYDALGGTASMTRRLDGSTEAVLNVTGAMPNTAYNVHIHDYSCGLSSGGGHYKVDTTVEGAIESNEMWLDFTSDASGNGTAQTSLQHLARPEAQSVVLHDAADGERLACYDLL